MVQNPPGRKAGIGGFGEKTKASTDFVAVSNTTETVLLVMVITVVCSWMGGRGAVEVWGCRHRWTFQVNAALKGEVAASLFTRCCQGRGVELDV